MTSKTTTTFKQKKCPKCGNNHDNEGVLCSFCIDKARIAAAKIQPPPESFWVKCLIQREGNTVLSIGNIQYTFKPNDHGDSVCEIINQGHYTQIIKNEFYEPYRLPELKPVINNDTKPPLFTKEQADRIDEMLSAGKKAKEIAEELSTKLEVTIPWQRVVKYMSTRLLA